MLDSLRSWIKCAICFVRGFRCWGRKVCKCAGAFRVKDVLSVCVLSAGRGGRGGGESTSQKVCRAEGSGSHCKAGRRRSMASQLMLALMTSSLGIPLPPSPCYKLVEGGGGSTCAFSSGLQTALSRGR